MMGVVVDHQDAAHFALRFEAPPYSRERLEGRGGGRGVVAQGDERGERGCRVQSVMSPRNVQRQGDGDVVGTGDPPPLLRPLQPPVGVRRLAEGDDAPRRRPVVPGHQTDAAGVVGGDDERSFRAHPGDERGEGGVVGVRVGEEIGVVVLDIGDDRDVRVKLEEGPVVLVGFDDHLLASTGRGVGARPAQHRPDGEAGIGAERAQRRHDHAAGRRLAMAAGDGHPAPRVGQRPEQPRPLHQRTTRGESGGDLGVVRAHRRRGDDEVGRRRRRLSRCARS